MNRTLIGGGIAAGLIAIMLFIFVGCERIDAGHVGIKVNMVGGDKGVSKTEYVTGWQFYFSPISKIYEFPVYQQHVEYEPLEVPSKGGSIFTLHPSFNYNVNSGMVAEMFQQLRQPLKTLEQGYIKNAMFIALREATNRFTVDSVLNNLSSYDAAVTDVLNTKLNPYFHVTQFTSNLKPDPKLSAAISAKAQAIQDAIALEMQQKTIKAQVENDILEARRDSSVKVMAAAAEARSISVKQQALQQSPQYVELIKAEKWNGVLPQYQFGQGTGVLLNLGK